MDSGVSTTRSPRTALRLILSLALAGTATFLAQRFDGERARAHVSDVALRGARQVAAQVEALYLEGRQNEASDPLGHAIYLFSQSPEPRLAEVKRLNQAIPGEGTENFSFDAARGVFEYAKMLGASGGDPEGVHVRVLAWRPGFLGARTTLQNDLSLVAVFFLNLFSWLFVLRFRSRQVVEVKTVEVPAPRAPGLTRAARPRRTPTRPALSDKVVLWRDAIRTALLQTGGEVRDVVRTAHNLTSSAQVSLEMLVGVQGKLHGELTHLHGARQGAERIARALRECEGKPEKFQQFAALLCELSERNAQALSKLERQVEPWSTEIDLAVSSFDDFALAADRMRAHIRRTTELMLEQAKLVKEMPSEPAGPEEAKSPGSGQSTRTIA